MSRTHSSRLWAISQIEHEHLLPDGTPDPKDSGPAQPGVALSSITAGDTVVSEESEIKFEGRQGDGWARNLTVVRLFLFDFSRINDERRRLRQISMVVSGILANIGPVFSSTWQVLVITTWTATLVNDPVRYSWFAFHPPLQTLALCFFTYGLRSLSLCHCHYLSLTYPT